MISDTRCLAWANPNRHRAEVQGLGRSNGRLLHRKVVVSGSRRRRLSNPRRQDKLPNTFMSRAPRLSGASLPHRQGEAT